MGIFINVTIDRNRCLGVTECGACFKACPVDIFIKNNHTMDVDEKILDECILCNLCLDDCTPKAIKISKNY